MKSAFLQFFLHVMKSDILLYSIITSNWFLKFLSFLGDLVHLAYSGLTKNSSFVNYVRDGLVKKVCVLCSQGHWTSID